MSEQARHREVGQDAHYSLAPASSESFRPVNADLIVQDVPVKFLEPSVLNRPTLWWVRDHYRGRIRTTYGERLASFEATSAIPDETKDLIRPQISSSVGLIKAHEAWADVVLKGFSWLYDGIYRAGWLWVPVALSIWLWSNAPFKERVLFVVLSLILWIAPGLDTKNERRMNRIILATIIILVLWLALLVFEVGFRHWSIDQVLHRALVILLGLATCRIIVVTGNNIIGLRYVKLSVALFLGMLATVFLVSSYYFLPLIDWLTSQLRGGIWIWVIAGALTASLLWRAAKGRWQDYSTPGGRVVGAVIYLFTLASSIIVAIRYASSVGAWLPKGVQVGLESSIPILLLLASINVANSLFRSSLYFWTYNKYPESEIIDTTLQIIQSIDTSTERWTTTSFKRYTASRLEYLAYRIERTLPRKLRSSDRLTDRWIGEQTRHASGEVRRWKRELLLRGNEAFQELCTMLGTILIRASDSRWVALLDTKEGSEKLAPALRSRLTTQLRHLAVAILPLAIVLGLEVSPLGKGLGSTLLDKLIPFAGVWLGLGILAWLDPNTENRISGAEKIMGIGGFFGKMG